MSTEASQIHARYQRRRTSGKGNPRTYLRPDRYLAHQEKERAFLQLFASWKNILLTDLRVLEIGCGTGANLLQLIRWGFDPKNLVGSELLSEHCEVSCARLPRDVQILHGDASELQLAAENFDIVLQSTVFTSILDDAFQEKLARRMWNWVAPGGGILWYDFTYNNPSNPDVRGVPRQRVRELFPLAHFVSKSVTLAPPIARWVTKVNPCLYSAFNCIPILRTHILCWLEKPDVQNMKAISRPVAQPGVCTNPTC